VDLDGRTALLTGATGGLGQAIARALAERGATLVLSARRAEALEAMSRELPGEGHRMIPTDLAEEASAVRLARAAGEVDVLVANAGVSGTGLMSDFTPDQLATALRVNLEVPMLLAKELSPAMQKRGSGHLVFIASLSGKAASPRSSVYSATKFGLRGFGLGLRTDLAASGVGVSVVSPGFVREAGMFAKSGARPPAGMGTTTPDQVAGAVVRAIERNAVEIGVAPARQRLLAHLGLASPRISARVQSGGAAQRATESIDAGHRRGAPEDSS
jgi:short-subunit dehydrogenase